MGQVLGVGGGGGGGGGGGDGHPLLQLEAAREISTQPPWPEGGVA